MCFCKDVSVNPQFNAEEKREYKYFLHWVVMETIEHEEGGGMFSPSVQRAGAGVKQIFLARIEAAVFHEYTRCSWKAIRCHDD